MSGKVAWINRNEPNKSQHILLFACEPAGCPVWINIEHANWIDIGSKIRVFGVYEGYQNHQTDSDQPLSAPSIRGRLITP